MIQERKKKHVDDTSGGGTIRFDSEDSTQYTRLLNVGLLDIDEGTANRIITKDRSGIEITTSSKAVWATPTHSKRSRLTRVIAMI